jgi:hypothetical protein
VLGRRDVRTTMIYTHVLDRGPLGVPARSTDYDAQRSAPYAASRYPAPHNDVLDNVHKYKNR